MLWKAAMVELKKEKEQRKIDHHTTNMFPKSGEGPTEKTWLTEMSEGIHTSVENRGGEGELEDEEPRSENEDDKSKHNKLKTRKQRRKELKVKMTGKRLKYMKEEKKRKLDVYRIKSMKKELIVEEKAIADRVAKRKELKELKKFLPSDLSGQKFEEAELDIKVTMNRELNYQNMVQEIILNENIIHFQIRLLI